jgi:hypothetical protein
MMKGMLSTAGQSLYERAYILFSSAKEEAVIRRTVKRRYLNIY